MITPESYERFPLTSSLEEDNEQFPITSSFEEDNENDSGNTETEKCGMCCVFTNGLMYLFAIFFIGIACLSFTHNLEKGHETRKYIFNEYYRCGNYTFEQYNLDGKCTRLSNPYIYRIAFVLGLIFSVPFNSYF